MFRSLGVENVGYTYVFNNKQESENKKQKGVRGARKHKDGMSSF